MRKIKFRVYNKKIKQTKLVTRLFFNEDKVEVLCDLNPLVDDISEYFLEDCFLMQFTGMEDESGKDIYEGDILKIKTNIIGTVKFGSYDDDEGYSTSNHLGWFLEGKSSVDDTHALGDYSESYLKIVGNIYENPELLQSKENLC